jgi:uncharacterized protein
LKIETSLSNIATADVDVEVENLRFKNFLKSKDSEKLDALVIELNDIIAPQIDCTKCGNCCQTLMINVTNEECSMVSKALQLNETDFKEKYIETSQQGDLIINSIPCTFLNEKKCTIYSNRFTECREFPHLHKKGFKQRLFGTLMHYGRCPIIYNVIEHLKMELNFRS